MALLFVAVGMVLTFVVKGSDRQNWTKSAYTLNTRRDDSLNTYYKDSLTIRHPDLLIHPDREQAYWNAGDEKESDVISYALNG